MFKNIRKNEIQEYLYLDIICKLTQSIRKDIFTKVSVFVS